MHDQRVYKDARAKDPEAFELADDMVLKYLCQGMIIVRGMVTYDGYGSGVQISEVEVLSLDWHYPGKGENSHEVLFHLRFRSEENRKTVAMSDCLFMDGPLWNEKPLLTADLVNQVGLVIHEWTGRRHLAWTNVDCPQFAGFLNLRRNTFMHVRAPSHQSMLPILCTCLGYLRGSHQQKLGLIEDTTSSAWSKAIRVNALDSLERRLGSFVMQAQDAAVRIHLGDLV